MSGTFSAPRWGIGAVLAGALGLVSIALLAFGPAPRASAAYSTTKCAGPDIIGRGASFARDAHKVFNFNFKNVYCNGTAGFGVINVEYEPLGSGAGRLSMKVREEAGPRFGMSDEPPSATEIAQMNAGTGTEPPETDVDPSDNGKIHVIPAAVGAVAPLVNFPDGCDPDELNPESRTDDAGSAADDALIRVRFNKSEYEKAWAKDAAFDEWDEVFPELEGAACEAPIIRVVRWDNSGTTFAFKDYLNALNPGRGWLTTYVTPDNRQWPNAEIGERSDCANAVGPGAQADTTDQLTSSCSNGAGNLVAKLKEVDGSIGYADISTARTAGLAIDPAGGDNDTFWTQVENGADDFVEPTADEDGFRTDGFKGANCGATEFDNVPGSTFEDWSEATGVNSKKGYGICTMTYGLVFDDNADVWGNSVIEEAKARTVKDYWENIVSEAGQAQLFGNDYSPLPPAVAKISKAGVAAIGWNKGEDTNKNDDNNHNDQGDEATPTNVAPAPPPLVPSNLFSLLRKQVSSKTGQANIAVKLPGAGRLVVVGLAKVQVGGDKGRANKRNHRRTRTVKVAQIVLNANRAGTFNLKLTPRGAARRELRKKGRLPVALRMTFTPSGGTANTSNSRVVLKYKKDKKGKRKSSGKRR